jgi:molecular chaperone GrpE
MGSPRRPTGPDPQGSPPADASASTGPSTGHPSSASPSRGQENPPGSSPASSAWDDLRQAVGAEEVQVEVEGGEDADPELIAEAERIADEALAEARAKEAAEAQDGAAGGEESLTEPGAGVPDAEVPDSELPDSELPDSELIDAERTLLVDLAKLAAERDDYLEQLRRVTADFDNYRKRIIKQQTEHLERAAEGLVEKLLAVLDTFDLALAHGEGFEQVYATLVGVLEKEGLERIDPLDQPFDPNEADAVAHEEAEEGPVVADVLRPGYRWKGRVLRPAMVKVRG